MAVASVGLVGQGEGETREAKRKEGDTREFPLWRSVGGACGEDGTGWCWTVLCESVARGEDEGEEGEKEKETKKKGRKGEEWRSDGERRGRGGEDGEPASQSQAAGDRGGRLRRVVGGWARRRSVSV